MGIINARRLAPPVQQKAPQFNQSIAKEAEPEVNRGTQVQHGVVTRRRRKVRGEEKIKRVAGYDCGAVFQPADR